MLESILLQALRFLDASLHKFNKHFTSKVLKRSESYIAGPDVADKLLEVSTLTLSLWKIHLKV